MNTTATGLEALRFDNAFTRALPADPEPENFRRAVKGAVYSRVRPVTVRAPVLVAHSREVAAMLGLRPGDCESPAFAEVFAGNRLLPGMDPHATCYGGHQFGNWAGQLGDGRAINLGEVRIDSGRRVMLQLKGAGPTPYSRTADGLAVLRSSVREFLCSEAMHHLGVPTTRALSVVLTGEQVLRDMLYDGNPALEPGAVVCRVAPSFTRFGHFEMLAARGEVALLRAFLDHTVREDFPELLEGHAAGSAALATAWFGTVCELTARMIVEWQRVGFVHGVMNTDNMSVLGLTIDYGPYGWLDDYDPDWTPNTTDAAGRRYRFGNQAAIAQWNLLMLANAIYPLVGDAAPLERALEAFAVRHRELWETMMAAKLGLARFDADRDPPLLDALDALLRAAETDMTLFFRALADLDPEDLDLGRDPGALLGDVWYAEPDRDVRARAHAWLTTWLTRVRGEGRARGERRAAMNAVNPLYVLRNYLAQLAIDDAERGDFARVRETLEVLRNPYAEQPGRAAFAAKRPDWARTRVGCSQLSCSS